MRDRDRKSPPKPDAMPLTTIVGSATAAALTVAILGALWGNADASPARAEPLALVVPWWVALALKADDPSDRP